MMKRLLCTLLCVGMMMSLMTACGDSKEGDSEMPENLAMEDMDYGATMRELKDGKITVCFDHRFIEDEEMQKVADYYYAVQTQDLELFKSTQNSEYLDYIEKNGGVTIEEYLKSIKNDDVQAVGKDFAYTYIEATECGGRKDDLEIDEIIKLMEQVYTDAKKDTGFEKTVKDVKYIKLKITAEAGGSSFTNEADTVYVFHCNEGVYVFK